MMKDEKTCFHGSIDFVSWLKPADKWLVSLGYSWLTTTTWNMWPIDTTKGVSRRWVWWGFFHLYSFRREFHWEHLSVLQKYPDHIHIWKLSKTTTQWLICCPVACLHELKGKQWNSRNTRQEIIKQPAAFLHSFPTIWQKCDRKNLSNMKMMIVEKTTDDLEQANPKYYILSMMDIHANIALITRIKHQMTD